MRKGVLKIVPFSGVGRGWKGYSKRDIVTHRYREVKGDGQMSRKHDIIYEEPLGGIGFIKS